MRYRFNVRPEGVLIEIDATFHALRDIDFGTQEEMGLGIRVDTPLMVRAGGRMLDASGRRNEKGIWGEQSAWCDYSGVVDGVRKGLTIFPHPGNAHAAWFHARDYGALVANPFGPRAGAPERLPLAAGKSHRIRFAVLAYAVNVARTVDYDAVADSIE